MSQLRFLLASLLALAASLDAEPRASRCVAWPFTAGQKARTRRLALVVSLAAILAVLVPLAHSSPADPTWVAGLWDNADHDDAVILATAGSSIADASVLTPFHIALVILGWAPDLRTGVLAVRPLAFDQPRAPPAA